jgi:hypothetical protein
MGNGLVADTGGLDQHSLAGYIEQEIEAVGVGAGIEPLPEEGREERTMLFAGIARGIVRYLGDHAEAFVVESHWTTDDTDDYRHDSDHDGYVRIRVGTGFPEHP